MRAEWAKSKARANRWEEEVTLTVEEMQCTIAFFDWKAHWWLNQASCRQVAAVALQSGLRAYAFKQADIYRALARSFPGKWHKNLVANSILIQWPSEYIPKPREAVKHTTLT